MQATNFVDRLFGRKSSVSQHTGDANIQAYIQDIHKYLNRRLYSPKAEILSLAFLEHSTTENNRHATATVQLFFQQTISQLQTYIGVLDALHPKDQMFITGKRKTLDILATLITDCQSFEANAAYYSLRVHDGTLKKFLNHTVQQSLATLELYLEKN
ncbi:MAG: hypothetical protein A2912_01340 [Candidatus Buchananbacteria bacterium RIFCSPLOWO2_01_FULL_40_23b]|uniref:Uncharacterized protein n=1 Tax=Candidatus Buchananbacteria bacterium RIFCSPLOWO2_01_FULL_40_23b TaxID=1797544 RepID=A0A1G1YVE1_9BACT|nr:MAG: hypothetical protein A2912_01340 [Candidatus Buchananbacteria bacterium RIFCSPLOWO2_01_FULL_40_23b]